MPCGTPVLRYADEIGVGEDLSLPKRRAERTPLTHLPALEHSSPDGRERHALALEPYGDGGFRVGPLLDIITRGPR